MEIVSVELWIPDERFEYDYKPKAKFQANDEITLAVSVVPPPIEKELVFAVPFNGELLGWAYHCPALTMFIRLSQDYDKFKAGEIIIAKATGLPVPV